MIGIKDTLDITAPLHGGRRAADKVQVTGQKQRNALTQTERTSKRKRSTNTARSLYPRKSGQLIALSGISDELSGYRNPTIWNRAA